MNEICMTEINKCVNEISISCGYQQITFLTPKIKGGGLYVVISSSHCKIKLCMLYSRSSGNINILIQTVTSFVHDCFSVCRNTSCSQKHIFFGVK